MFLVDSFPDVGDLGDTDLKAVLDRLLAEQRDVLTEEFETSSYKRRILHGKIDVVRAELVNRRRRRHEGGDGPDDSGGAGTRERRRPNPQPGCGSISLPAPEGADDDDRTP